MEVPEMVRMALSELIKAAMMAEPAAVMVYRGLWHRRHEKEAKLVSGNMEDGKKGGAMKRRKGCKRESVCTLPSFGSMCIVVA
jgi:hypothetical protein